MIQNKFIVLKYVLMHYALRNEVRVVEGKIKKVSDLKGKRSNFDKTYRDFDYSAGVGIGVSRNQKRRAIRSSENQTDGIGRRISTPLTI